MSSPMPILPGAMCSLCFDTIYDGEHHLDEHGQRWDSHEWCDLMDRAMLARKLAQRRRDELGLPKIEP